MWFLPLCCGIVTQPNWTSRDWLNFESRLGELVLTLDFVLVRPAGPAHRAGLARRGGAGAFGLCPQRLIGQNYLYGINYRLSEFGLC
jgi:hypothetical protein